MTKVINSKIQELKTALNTKFMERSELIDGLLTALLAQDRDWR